MIKGLVKRPLEALIPYAQNARTHSDEQVAQLAASIKEFGWTNPVLIDEANGIIAGHGRVLAAKLLQHSEIPCIRLVGLSEEQKRAYVLADNKLAMNAGWNEELLKGELEALKLAEFDVSLLGFSALELNDLFSAELTATEIVEDEAPPLPELPVTQPGDLWILGKHRVICGDCTAQPVIERLLDGAKPHLMVTDPPYGVEYEAAWRNKALRADGSKIGARAVGSVSNDDRSDWREAWVLFPGEVAYCWHADRHASSVQASLEAAGFEIRCQLVWVKQQFAIGRGHYHWQHEPCWYAVRKGGTGHWAGGRKQTTVWSIDKPQKSETGHSTQKPVACMLKPMLNNSDAGDLVYDPFLGSGTTLIAAVQAGRFAYCAELNPAYVDVAVKRWQAFTGGTALCNGESFDDRAATIPATPLKQASGA